MANHQGPRIITDSLLLALDAANARSYTFGSTAWADLSGNGNSGSLINGPAYNNTNIGSLYFNGINSYVNAKNTTTLDFTLECWINTTTSSLAGGFAYQGTPLMWASTGSYGLTNSFTLSILNNRASFYTAYPSANINGTSTITTGNWVHIVAARSGNTGRKSLYINGVLEASGSDTTNILNAYPSITIGGDGISKFYNGNIASAKVYSRVLSAAEVLQNYNALYPRFATVTSNVITYVTLNQAFVIGLFNDTLEISPQLTKYPSYASANAFSLVVDP
jgi:hypothetical protein